MPVKNTRIREIFIFSTPAENRTQIYGLGNRYSIR